MFGVYLLMCAPAAVESAPVTARQSVIIFVLHIQGDQYQPCQVSQCTSHSQSHHKQSARWSFSSWCLVCSLNYRNNFTIETKCLTVSLNSALVFILCSSLPNYPLKICKIKMFCVTQYTGGVRASNIIILCETYIGWYGWNILKIFQYCIVMMGAIAMLMKNVTKE